MTPRTHALPVNGYCPRCRVHEWDTAARPLTERVTGYAPNATCAAREDNGGAGDA